MEHYDVIIVGGGIAGTGFACNLKRHGYKGRILLLDKNDLGANSAYGHRTVFKELIDEYNLPYFHKFKGVKIGGYDKVYFNIDEDFYFIDYKECCNFLFKYSDAYFVREEANLVKKNVLYTNKSRYGFDYLIDCTGSSFFIRKQLNKQVSFRYWIGNLKLLDNEEKIKEDYFYYMFSNNGFLEEFAVTPKGIISGYWQYESKIDYSRIRPHKKTKLRKYLHNKILKQSYCALPVSPVLPLVFKNCATLGDSFGIASSSMAFGVSSTLEASKSLVLAIKKENLRLYEKEWKEKNLDTYIKYLVSKFDTFNNCRFIEKIKSYPSKIEAIKRFSSRPEVFLWLMKDHKLSVKSLPTEFKEGFPKRQVLFQMYYYSYLRLKYLLMEVIPQRQSLI